MLLKSQVTIPKQLENELKTIITDENEYEQIKIELAKSPHSSDDFLKIYNEIQQKEGFVLKIPILRQKIQIFNIIIDA